MVTLTWQVGYTILALQAGQSAELISADVYYSNQKSVCKD